MGGASAFGWLFVAWGVLGVGCALTTEGAGPSGSTPGAGGRAGSASAGSEGGALNSDGGAASVGGRNTGTGNAAGGRSGSGEGGGGGSRACGVMETDCGGACVDLQTDPNHCGACGNVCQGADPACCPADGGNVTVTVGAGGSGSVACADLDSDASNCGSCGDDCVDESCDGGSCD